VDSVAALPQVPELEDRGQGHRGPVPGRRDAGRRSRPGPHARRGAEQEPFLEPRGAGSPTTPLDDFSRITRLLESRDPEAILIVGQFLAQSALTNQLHIGPTGESPEPAAFLGAFSLVACDFGPDCAQLKPELQLACAHGAYCDAQTFEELYQNFMASPWVYVNAMRYRGIIRNAIQTQDWSLIGLTPKAIAEMREKIAQLGLE
jgi:hypothetical protein